MMKIIISLSVFILSIFNLSAQKKYFDVGAIGGTSYYLGDINPSRQFYKPSPAFGAFARFNLNNREAIRLSFTYMSLGASDRDFNNIYQQNRGAELNASFLEVSPTFEFHFLPYIIHKRDNGFSPYIFGGLGYIAFAKSNGNITHNFTVPFGAGIKYSLSKRIGVGLEWGMRKTFEDNMDLVINPGDANVKNPLNNNDWYSFAGFFISFRLNDNSGDCPVYW
jgi:opacity protein-like surface antigen